MDIDRLINECAFATARSGGSGGQNVNKVETKVTLIFDVRNSLWLSDEQKAVIFSILKNRINKDGVLQLSSESERTQGMNKKKAIEKFTEIIQKALTPAKKRKATKPTAMSIKRRLEEKKKLSEKKKQRLGNF